LTRTVTVRPDPVASVAVYVACSKEARVICERFTMVNCGALSVGAPTPPPRPMDVGVPMPMFTVSLASTGSVLASSTAIITIVAVCAPLAKTTRGLALPEVSSRSWQVTPDPEQVKV